ncbi:MAG: LicD family protein [Lachnospiraceae bacterium]|nr:LicD family protein [Lachnospiraceae bacterium]
MINRLDEVRDGFFITNMMKRNWMTRLDLLEIIDRVCKEHRIRYFLGEGTLLGAVRHRGYIPWDDDIDLYMMRPDFDRFFAMADDVLPAPFHVSHVLEPNMHRRVSKISGGDEIIFTNEYLSSHHGFPYPYSIDIFPLDAKYPDPAKEEDRRSRIREITAMLQTEEDAARREELESQRESAYTACPFDEAREVTFFSHEGTIHVFQKQWFEPESTLLFEDRHLPVPSDYDMVLTTRYHNYMTGVRDESSHIYPCYALYEEQFRDFLGHNPFRYTYDASHLQRSRIIQEQAKDILFLPVRSAWWPAMHSAYHTLRAQEQIHITVAPVPFRLLEDTADHEGLRSDLSGFPQDLPLVDVRTVDICSAHYDMIFIQFPYDGTNSTMSVPEGFFSSALRSHCERLVYIPPYLTDDPSPTDPALAAALEVLIEQPAVMFADHILVSSELMRVFYIEILCIITGEENRTVWEDKIIVHSADEGAITS